MRRLLRLQALIVVGAVLPCTVAAQTDSTASTDASARGLRFNGFAEASYSFNTNRPPSGINGLRVFDVNDNEFRPDVVEAVMQVDATEPNDVGFRADVTVGASIPRVTAARGLFRRDDGTGEDIDLQQAYVRYVAPVGSGLGIDLGKFVTWAGYEVIDGYDGFNDNATRGYLFGYAVPFTHTGIRIGYEFNSVFAASIMAVNGWDVVDDNNTGKTFGTQLLLTPSPDVLVALTYIGGPELDSNDADLRHLVDVVAAWEPGEAVTFGANFDYGVDEGALGVGSDALWRGVAAYVTVAFEEEFSLALRGEVFDDRDGVRTGTAQTLKEITLTPTFSPTENLTFRADFRIDFSTDPMAFERSGDRTTNNQPTVTVSGAFTL